MRKRIVREEILYSDRTAITDAGGNKVTYKGLAEKAESFLSHMEERSLIYILCDKQMETVEFIYSMFYLNIVPLLLPEDIEKELVEKLIAHYRPQYIYCSKSSEISCLYQQEIELENHIVMKTSACQCDIHPDIAVLLSTSGSTGSSKLVKLSYDNLCSSAEQVCSCLDIQCGQKGISPLSMSYVYGLTFCIWHWYCGAELLVTDASILSSEFREFYKREKANNFAGTPYMYQMMQRIRFWDADTLATLHRAMSGGSQMLDSVQEEMISIMQDKFWIMYGQTECTGTILGMNFDKDNIKLGSIGRALKDVEAEADKKTGELILKSRNVSMGYVNNAGQLADGDVNQGVLHTGDVVYIDDDNCIYLRGRLNRYVKILGKRVSLDDIEKFLNNMIPDAGIACAGADDSIFVFYSGKIGELDRRVPDLLDCKMKIPKKFISCFYVEEIPRNSSGKIMYAKLNEMRTECRKKY